jgi:hypothetical protein
VLEEEEEGRGAEKGGVLPVELGATELWRAVGGRLGGCMAGYGCLGGVELRYWR